MPLYKDYNDTLSQILIWKYHESDVFDEKLLISSEEYEKVQRYHSNKKLEYLMIRQMLHQILPKHQIHYRTHGQPFLYPKDAYLSISHSFPYVSLAVSSKRIGIDLEKTNPKILKIKHKFIHPTEEPWVFNQDNEIEILTIIWTIKEALYKLHPSKYWSLKKHYEVEKFSLTALSTIHCKVFDANFQDEYTARIDCIDGYYYAIIEENHLLNYQIV